MTREAGQRHLVPVRRTLVLDSEALSRVVCGDAGMMALIKAAPQREIAVVTSALTTIEAWDPRAGKRGAALWDWALSRIGVVHTDDQLISVARSLLRETGLHGHKYAIDAVLAAVALAASGQGHDVTVLTSDTDDLKKFLADSAVNVEPV